MITRGNGKQILFETNDDYQYYLSLLERYSEETQIKICVYCLMNNHTHFLVYDEDNNLSLFMKRLGTAYAIYYNRKYEHYGHVFQNRFKSVVIENELQFMAACKYILLNPEKAGICKHSVYPWSSYSFYFTESHFTESDTSGFLDQTLVHAIFANKHYFYEFLSASTDGDMDDDVSMEYNVTKKDDLWANTVMKNLLQIDSGTYLQSVGRKQRDIALHQLKAAGLSIRQIQRLTGLSRGVIQRA